MTRGRIWTPGEVRLRQLPSSGICRLPKVPSCDFSSVGWWGAGGSGVTCLDKFPFCNPMEGKGERCSLWQLSGFEGDYFDVAHS